jgi:signal peptidase I
MLGKSWLWAFVIALVLGYLLGFKLILVNGWSAEPEIHYQSLILTSKYKIEDVEKGDFVTYSYSGQSYITHQVIAVNNDGSFFEKDQIIDVLIDGENYELKFGYKLTSEGEISTEEDTSVTTNCNIIVMQRTYNTDGSFNLSASLEYLNYDNNVKGRVIAQSYAIGKTIFLLRSNMFILFGVLSCFVLLFIIKNQCEIDFKPDFIRE